MFDKLKDMMALKNQMEQVKRELDASVFEIQSSDGLVKVSMNGSQELKSISILAELKQTDKAALEQALKDAYTRAIRRSHEIASQKMSKAAGI